MNRVGMLEKQIYSPPSSVIYLQCTLFAILFGIWVLPETILVRHLCLFIGAGLGLYVIFRNRSLFLNRAAIAIWILLSLFAWVTLHLIFLSSDFDAQWLEFGTIWKRSFIGFIFALSLGLSIGLTIQSRALALSQYWKIIYAGFALPILIYWMKYVVSFLAMRYQISVPEYLMLYDQSAKFYIHKSAYVFFCLPLLAISLGFLYQLYGQRKLFQFSSLIYFASVIAVVLNFLVEKDRNGEIYSIFFFLLFFGLIARDYLKVMSIKKITLGIFVLLIPIVVMFFQLKGNTYWNHFFSDAKIAVQIEKYDHWKDTQNKGLPIDDEGKMLTGSNYERIAWGTIAIQFIAEHPWGFGLVEKSFGRLGMTRWPDAKLHQSHSGWLDFTLGMGIPATLLILFASIYACIGSQKLPAPWNLMGSWGLVSMLLLFCTTEVSQKVYIDAFIFIVTFVSSLNLGAKALELELV